MNSKNFAIFVSIIVGVVIIAGFFIVGSPTSERARRFDEQRVSDITSLQYELVYFWQQKNKLPDKLEELNNGLGTFHVPQDPETKADYEYRKTGDLSFELCANFRLANQDKTGLKSAPAPYPVGPYGDIGSCTHGAGRVCFPKTIDPQLYKRPQ